MVFKVTHKKWLKLWFLISILIGGLIFISIKYLKSIYENNTYKEIIARQIKNNSIYGTALNQNTFGYKLELIKQLQPEIVAMGSSRVMQFREESFNTSFVNAGGAMNYLSEGILFLNEMLKFHKPKHIILGLDFWWFTNNRNEPSFYPYHNNTGDILTQRKILEPYYWLLINKIDITSFKYLFNNSLIVNPLTNHDSLGIQAINTSNGFRRDGSYFYGKYIFGLEVSKDEKFKNTLQRIEQGVNRFEYGNELSFDKFNKLKRIINILTKNNIEITIVIPPLSLTSYDKLQKYKDKYNYIKKLFIQLTKNNITYYNFHNPKILNTNDCEFVDGFHGGDVVYQKILYFVSQNEKYLTKYLNTNLIEKNIDNYKGRTLSIENSELYFRKEIDFLRLGCNK
ncbi:MAG: hypothetical protein ACNI3H_15130 [Halarcobacter ebronensis]|uniref:hypothetical protein n=1 Tax=Halarcobacter ebronensis TaxID=1462615 RepID=UPI003C78607C